MLTSQSNDPREQTIETAVHGRYIFRASDSPVGTLIGFHGYGENAERHLAELLRIPAIERWSVVSVQALHPFYVQRTGEIVASWMTSQHRELAIADNVGYVRRVVSALGTPRPLVFLGFSQGAAMAYRAASSIECDGVIALGGDLPPDVRSGLPERVLIGRGVHDEWYTGEKLANDLRFLPRAEVCEFEGGHEFTDAFRARVAQFLASL